MQKLRKITKRCFNLNKASKHFSITHNYHSPATLWVNGREYKFDDNLEEYSSYIQAFLNRRYTHKKEISPKIKVLKDMNNVLRDYHNSFYVQITYPTYNLFDLDYLRYMQAHKIIDSGYIISRFFEEYEKPMYDAMLTKFLINGRVEFMEDRELFYNYRQEINKLIKVFYDGDKLSYLEREIERAYLILKQSKNYELVNKYVNNPKLKKEECVLTFSELNKMSGHVNFRMCSPEYFFKACPIFERIDVEKMFYSLYEIRYNSLSKFQIFEKLKLKYQYRKSLLKTQHRVQFVAYFIYLRIFQYLESYEYNNEFNLSLNFKINFNMLVFHTWLIVQRLKIIINSNDNKDNTRYAKYLVKEIIEKIVNYFNNNIGNFQFSHRESEKIIFVDKFIHKIFDFLTWNFYVVNNENKFNNIKNLINDVIFENTRSKDDKYLKRLCYYSLYHFFYFNDLSYEKIEKTDFDFSVNNVPISAHEFVDINDKLSDSFKSYSQYLTGLNNIDNVNITETLKNYKENEFLFFEKYNKAIKIEDLSNKTKEAEYKKIFQELISKYGVNPYKDKNNFYEYDIEKSAVSKLNKYVKNEIIYETAIAHEKVMCK